MIDSCCSHLAPDHWLMLFSKVLLRCFSGIGLVSLCRLSLEPIQRETNALIERLEMLKRTVSSSSEDLKQQYLPLIQVQVGSNIGNSATCCFLFFFCGIFRTVCKRVSRSANCCWWWRRRKHNCVCMCVKTAATSPLMNSSAPSEPSEGCSSEPSRSVANQKS